MVATSLATVECPAEEFVWWLRRNRLTLPDLLSMTPSTNIETDVEELVRWAREDEDRVVRVANDPSARVDMDFPAGWSTRMREVAAGLARVLAQPRWVCFAGRQATTGAESFAGGVADRSDAVVIDDDGQRVRLLPLRPPEVAAEVAGAVLPRTLVTADFESLRISPSVAKAAGGDTAKLLKGARADARDVAAITAMEQKFTAGGFVGACAYTPHGQCPGPFAAQWRESPTGGYLVSGADGEAMHVEPLTTSSLTRALVEAVASAQ